MKYLEKLNNKIGGLGQIVVIDDWEKVLQEFKLLEDLIDDVDLDSGIVEDSAFKEQEIFPGKLDKYCNLYKIL